LIYAYKGITAEGKRVKDKIEAESLEQAKAKLKSAKIIYESIKEERASFLDGVSFSRKYRISNQELSQLSRELSMYIRSGITIVSAIKIVSNHYESNKKISLFLKTVATHLDEGKNFYTALITQSVITLPPFFLESIKVSENSGILDEVLLELSRFLKEQDKIIKEIKGAFAYPAFMIVVSVVIVGAMLAFVVPQITGIFSSMHQELPVMTRVVIAAGDAVNNHMMGGLITITIIIAIHTLLMKYRYIYRYAVHRFILKMPIIGDIALKSELARFAYISSLLVRSGVTFVQTINLSANILNNEVLKKIFLDASKEVVEGKKLSRALAPASKILDATFIQSIALGEETSQLENVLVNISELYFEENRDKIALLLSLLEPALMLFVGGMIGGIVAAMLLPIFSMSIS